MKKLSFKFLCLLSLVLFGLPALAQTVTIDRAYKYSNIAFYDSNETLQYAGEIPGVIAFSSGGGQRFISITIGDEVRYNGSIYSSKSEVSTCKVYLFTTEFQGASVPIQLFENYDNGLYLPSSFIIVIHNQQGSIVQYVFFDNISRVK